jgi:hypothetical protein
MLLANANEAHKCTEHTLQHIKTDAAEAIDVGVVDAREEANLWRGHGVVIGEEELSLEHTTYLLCQYLSRNSGVQSRHTLIWGLRWSIDRHVEVTQVVVVRHCADSRHAVLIAGQQGVTCDSKEFSTHASSARRWVSLMIRLERAIVAGWRLSRIVLARRGS